MVWIEYLIIKNGYKKSKKIKHKYKKRLILYKNKNNHKIVAIKKIIVRVIV